MDNEKPSRHINESLKNIKSVSEISKTLTGFAGINDLIKSFSKTIQPSIQTSTPQVLIDRMSSLSSQANSSASILKTLTEGYSRQLDDMFKSLSKLAGVYYPSNWVGPEREGLRLPDNLEALLLDEGLPLAWIPPYDVLKKVLEAKDFKARKEVLYSSRQSILNECVSVLSSIDNRELKSYISFAVESIDSIRSGHWRSSQALSANLMDSVISQMFTKADRVKLTSQKKRIDWGEYPVKEALVIGGIWGSYGTYRHKDGDRIPHKFTRNASAHAVSDKQYSKINSLIALMHTVALLKFISELLGHSKAKK